MSDKLGNFDIQIDDSLRNVGFTEVSIIHKNIVVRLADGHIILSKFKIQDLADDLKKLEGKLYAHGIDENSAQQLVTFIVTELLPKVEQAVSNLVHSTQQLEEKNTLISSNYDPCKHEEKIINITQKINSGSSEDNNIQQQIGMAIL